MQLKKMLVMYESVHVGITFQLHVLELSSVTTPNQTVLNCILAAEGERLFQCGIALGKTNSSGHHCMSGATASLSTILGTV